MKRTWIFTIAAVMALALSTGCGGEAVEGEAVPSQQPEQTMEYKQGDFIPLPDEEMYHQDTLLVSDIERDMAGRPALYKVESGLDDSNEPYAQIIQYSLTEKGEWDTSMFCAQSLTKRVKKTGGRPFDLPYIRRGDDGNLYALLQIGGKIEEKIQNPFAPREDEEDVQPAEYFLLQFDEEKDAFSELKLQMDEQGEKEGGKAADKVSQFHVMEDGSPFLVFGAGRAVLFEGDKGTVASDETVTDRAFEKNVGFGDHEFIYYSSASKLFQVMDKESMEVTTVFGDEIEEADRGKDWYYDTHTDEWQMYAFNVSGLYQIGEYGKKISVSCISEYGSFSALAAGTNIYDILVDESENVYALVRRQSEESYSFDEHWDFGIIKYNAARAADTSSTSTPGTNPGAE